MGQVQQRVLAGRLRLRQISRLIGTRIHSPVHPLGEIKIPRLFLVRSDGYGNLANDGNRTSTASSTGGSEIASYNTMLGLGDVDGDSDPDILGRKPSGELYLLRVMERAR